MVLGLPAQGLATAGASAVPAALATDQARPERPAVPDALPSGTPGPLSDSLPYAATLTHQDSRAPGRYDLPVGPYADGALPVRSLSGRVSLRSWRLSSRDMTVEQMAAPLRKALVATGWDVVLDCSATSCGGFDFRFATEVIAPPDMAVDLFDFQAISARRQGPEGPQAIFLLISHGPDAGYVQRISVTPMTGPAPGPAAPEVSDPVALPAEEQDTGTAPPQVAEGLAARGHAVLPGLDFATGSATLATPETPSLAALAQFLKADAARRVILVGHTDSEGGLDSNMALSLHRAQAVEQVLKTRYGVPAGQISARGIGFLAPRDSNDSRAGRQANRRVEAVLASTP
ncbi:OmpA family protein [Pseudooceanicola sp. CBS1P-1]|uniref:OmpA family protein n=1 Tax=Pseudooceanicola albus TaxID=2692189 RepID=A0A6L7G8Q4_9RHOB|nr:MULTISPECIES: OmpA family protein [Pseudooceanicola]MBT9384114.1 OmpA family protein [Pseudooceanicola endophyticus]MXN19786.1 OmpA family protein [Pseudooceanicola albus]